MPNKTNQLRPVGFEKVRIQGGFWGRLMETNRKATLPIEYKQCKDTGRIDAWKLDWKPGKPNQPHIFWDSDVAKWIEAAAYSLKTHPDKALEKRIDGVIGLMAKAQARDGYLNSHYLAVEPKKRWTNLRDCHELYCAGHLMEAAVAYYFATGKRKFLDIICRYADHIGRVFGRGKGQKRGYCGHEEVELALMKLYHTTNEPRYRELARYFINERGRKPYYFDIESKARGEKPNPAVYPVLQADRPVWEQTAVTGHAVRAMYLYSGMADVAAATGDKRLLETCKRLWQNVTRRRMHVTGGLGPTHACEGFTTDYDLPAEGAYLETCATIALVFWAHRMLRADWNADYADVMERALYNGTISGVSADGKRFFYGNPLAVQPGFDGNAMFQGDDYRYRRSEWFGCACCPPNIARMIAQFPGYMYSRNKTGIAVNLYAGSSAEIQAVNQTIRIVQVTRYPWDGKIRLTVTPESEAMWTLALRIPGWCRNATLKVNGKTVGVKGILQKGYAVLRREWRKGDRVELNLAMPVERIEAHPAARQTAGRIALQRGPLVYCLEETDNGKNLNDLMLPAAAKLKAAYDPKLLGGAVVLLGTALRRGTGAWKNDLYRSSRSRLIPAPVKAIPYYLWNNRKAGEMIMWIRQQ